MVKEIRLDKNHLIELDSSMGWLFVYRETFGHDIFPDLMPMLESVLTAGINVLQNADGGDIIGAIDGETLSDLFINVSGLELTSMLQIIWAMHKNAHSDAEPPETWFNKFGTFPLDVVFPKVMKMIIDSSVSAKNSKRLMTKLKGLKNSTLNNSQSQVLTEG